MSDGNSLAAEKSNWQCLRERGTVRSAIVAAAQEMLAREGPDAVTLGAMVRQTKIPRATVYSLFTSRKALLSELKAVEPVGTIVEPAADCAPPAEPQPEQGESDAVVAPPPEENESAPVNEIAAEAAATGPEPVAEITPSQEVREPAGTGDDSGAYDQLMREQAEALQELSRQVIVAKPHRDAVDVAMTRLETRVTVTERSLAALEQNVGERLKTLTAETSSLGETLAGLKMRIHKFEERQQAALAQLKLEVHNLGNGPQPVLPDAAPVEPAVAPVVAPVVEIAPAAQATSSEPEDPQPEEAVEETPDVPKMPVYLTSARLAAIHAAARAEARLPRRHRNPGQVFLRRNRWLLVAIAAVLVVWFDVYVFAHYQPADAAAPVARGQSEVVRPAAANGPSSWSPRAQLVRGLKYLNGTGVPVDVDKAHLWLERAALAGNPIAQNLMGVLYQTGTGVPADMNAAIRWYEAAAAQGNLKAMTNLGKVYAGGWRDGTDYVKAAEWFTKAAAFGDVDAEFDLAVLYERGEGVPRNLVQAYKWYMIAGKNGDNHAAVRATTLAAGLDREALGAVESAVTDFSPRAADHAANDVPAVSG